MEEYAILVLDPSGRVLTWNAGARRIKGYDADEIIGKDFSMFFTDDDVATWRPSRLLAEASERGRANDEGWRVRKDGSQFWANVVITALRDDQGDLRAYVKVTRDDTDRCAAEQHQRELSLFQDREALAAELASVVINRLFRAGMAVASIRAVIGEATVQRRIDDAVEQLDLAIADLRKTILGGVERRPPA